MSSDLQIKTEPTSAPAPGSTSLRETMTDDMTSTSSVSSSPSSSSSSSSTFSASAAAVVMIPHVSPASVIDLHPLPNETAHMTTLRVLSTWHDAAIPELEHLISGRPLITYSQTPVSIAPLPPTATLPNLATPEGEAVARAVKSLTPQTGSGTTTGASGTTTQATRSSTRSSGPLQGGSGAGAGGSNQTPAQARSAARQQQQQQQLQQYASVEQVLRKTLSENALRFAEISDAKKIRNAAMQSPEEVTSALEELTKRKHELSIVIRRFQLEAGRRLTRAQEPPRTKTHWDFVLGEMEWMATDFTRERKWKMQVARKLSKAVMIYHQRKAGLAQRAEKESEVHAKRVAAHVSRMVRQFWVYISRLVHFKHEKAIEAKKQVELNKHLEEMVERADHLSASIALDLQRGAGTAARLASSSSSNNSSSSSSSSSTGSAIKHAASNMAGGKRTKSKKEESKALPVEPSPPTPAVGTSTRGKGSRRSASSAGSLSGGNTSDVDYLPKKRRRDESEDDMTTLLQAEAEVDSDEEAHEIAQLEADSLVPIEDILKDLESQGWKPSTDMAARMSRLRSERRERMKERKQEKEARQRAAKRRRVEDTIEKSGKGGVTDNEVLDKALHDAQTLGHETSNTYTSSSAPPPPITPAKAPLTDGDTSASPTPASTHLSRSARIKARAQRLKSTNSGSRKGKGSSGSSGRRSRGEESAGESEFEASQSESDDEAGIDADEEAEIKECGSAESLEAAREAELIDLEKEKDLPLDELLRKYYPHMLNEKTPSLGLARPGGIAGTTSRTSRRRTGLASSRGTSSSSVGMGDGESMVDKEQEQGSPMENDENEEDEVEGEEEGEHDEEEADEDDVDNEEQGSDTTPLKHTQEDQKRLEASVKTASAFQPVGSSYATQKVRTAVPHLLRGQLREYQHIGLDWLVSMYENKLNGILADEMGLGKTIMTISWLAWLACSKGVWGQHLVIVPTSVMINWEMEFKRFCPGFKVLCYHGTAKERQIKRKGWNDPNTFHVCITSYQLALQDARVFKRKKWHCLILDEAHNIKNFKSQRWQAMLTFRTERRLLLTGTPLQNNLMELWALMHFLMPQVFQSRSDFKDWFNAPVTGMIEGKEQVNPVLISRLHGVLRPFILRRLKKDVAKQLPEKHEHVIKCRLSKRQRTLYEEFVSLSETQRTLQSGNFLGMMSVLLQLRKVCNHPDLFAGRPIISPLDLDPIISHAFSASATHAIASTATTPLHPSSLRATLVSSSAALVWQPSPITTPNFGPGLLGARSLLDNPLPPCLAPSVSSTSLINNPELLPPHPLGAMPGALFSPNGTVFYNPSSLALTPYSTATAVRRGINALGGSSSLALLPPFSADSFVAHLIDNGIDARESPFMFLVAPPIALSQRDSQAFTLRLVNCGPVRSNIPQDYPEKDGSNSDWSLANPLPKTYKDAVSTLRSIEIANSIELDKKHGGSGSNSVDDGFNSFWKDVNAARTKELLRTRARNTLISHLRTELTAPILYPSSLTAAVAVENPVLCARTRLQYGYSGVGVYATAADPPSTFPSTARYVTHQSPRVQPARLGADVQILCNVPTAMTGLVLTPVERLAAIEEELFTYTCLIPKARAPAPIRSPRKGEPTLELREARSKFLLKHAVDSFTDSLRARAVRSEVYFPDKRLLQWDCGKLQALAKLLVELKAGGHRTLIFTQFAQMLDILETFLNSHGHTYLRLDGSTKVEERARLMEKFNTNTKYFCFILSTRAGGVGVNLTGADTVVFYDTDWNPAIDQQAQDRCHRIGQTREVHIYRLVTENSVEENILKKSNQKRLMNAVVIGDGQFTTDYLDRLDPRELLGLKAIDEVNDESAAAAAVAKAKEASGSATTGQPRSARQYAEMLEMVEDEEDRVASRALRKEQQEDAEDFDESSFYDKEGARVKVGGSSGVSGQPGSTSSGQPQHGKDDLQSAIERRLNPVQRLALRYAENYAQYILSSDPAVLRAKGLATTINQLSSSGSGGNSSSSSSSSSSTSSHSVSGSGVGSSPPSFSFDAGPSPTASNYGINGINSSSSGVAMDGSMTDTSSSSSFDQGNARGGSDRAIALSTTSITAHPQSSSSNLLPSQLPNDPVYRVTHPKCYRRTPAPAALAGDTILPYYTSPLEGPSVPLIAKPSLPPQPNQSPQLLGPAPSPSSSSTSSHVNVPVQIKAETDHLSSPENPSDSTHFSATAMTDVSSSLSPSSSSTPLSATSSIPHVAQPTPIRTFADIDALTKTLFATSPPPSAFGLYGKPFFLFGHRLYKKSTPSTTSTRYNKKAGMYNTTSPSTSISALNPEGIIDRSQFNKLRSGYKSSIEAMAQSLSNALGVNIAKLLPTMALDDTEVDEEHLFSTSNLFHQVIPGNVAHSSHRTNWRSSEVHKSRYATVRKILADLQTKRYVFDPVVVRPPPLPSGENEEVIPDKTAIEDAEDMDQGYGILSNPATITRMLPRRRFEGSRRMLHQRSMQTPAAAALAPTPVIATDDIIRIPTWFIKDPSGGSTQPAQIKRKRTLRQNRPEYFPTPDLNQAVMSYANQTGQEPLYGYPIPGVSPYATMASVRQAMIPYTVHQYEAVPMPAPFGSFATGSTPATVTTATNMKTLVEALAPKSPYDVNILPPYGLNSNAIAAAAAAASSRNARPPVVAVAHSQALPIATGTLAQLQTNQLLRASTGYPGISLTSPAPSPSLATNTATLLTSTALGQRDIKLLPFGTTRTNIPGYSFSPVSTTTKTGNTKNDASAPIREVPTPMSYLLRTSPAAVASRIASEASTQVPFLSSFAAMQQKLLGSRHLVRAVHVATAALESACLALGNALVDVSSSDAFYNSKYPEYTDPSSYDDQVRRSTAPHASLLSKLGPEPGDYDYDGSKLNDLPLAWRVPEDPFETARQRIARTASNLNDMKRALATTVRGPTPSLFRPDVPIAERDIPLEKNERLKPKTFYAACRPDYVTPMDIAAMALRADRLGKVHFPSQTALEAVTELVNKKNARVEKRGQYHLRGKKQGEASSKEVKSDETLRRRKGRTGRTGRRSKGSLSVSRMTADELIAKYQERDPIGRYLKYFGTYFRIPHELLLFKGPMYPRGPLPALLETPPAPCPTSSPYALASLLIGLESHPSLEVLGGWTKCLYNNIAAAGARAIRRKPITGLPLIPETVAPRHNRADKQPKLEVDHSLHTSPTDTSSSSSSSTSTMPISLQPPTLAYETTGFPLPPNPLTMPNLEPTHPLTYLFPQVCTPTVAQRAHADYIPALVGQHTTGSITRQGLFMTQRDSRSLTIVFTSREDLKPVATSVAARTDYIWRPEEDELLTHLVSYFGNGNWPLISDVMSLHPLSRMRLKTVRQCYLRYATLYYRNYPETRDHAQPITPIKFFASVGDYPTYSVKPPMPGDLPSVQSLQALMTFLPPLVQNLISRGNSMIPSRGQLNGTGAQSLPNQPLISPTAASGPSGPPTPGGSSSSGGLKRKGDKAKSSGSAVAGVGGSGSGLKDLKRAKRKDDMSDGSDSDTGTVGGGTGERKKKMKPISTSGSSGSGGPSTPGAVDAEGRPVKRLRPDGAIDVSGGVGAGNQAMMGQTDIPLTPGMGMGGVGLVNGTGPLRCLGMGMPLTDPQFRPMNDSAPMPPPLMVAHWVQHCMARINDQRSVIALLTPSTSDPPRDLTAMNESFEQAVKDAHAAFGISPDRHVMPADIIRARQLGQQRVPQQLFQQRQSPSPSSSHDQPPPTGTVQPDGTPSQSPVTVTPTPSSNSQSQNAQSPSTIQPQQTQPNAPNGVAMDDTGVQTMTSPSNAPGNHPMTTTSTSYDQSGHGTNEPSTTTTSTSPTPTPTSTGQPSVASVQGYASATMTGQQQRPSTYYIPQTQGQQQQQQQQQQQHQPQQPQVQAQVGQSGHYGFNYGVGVARNPSSTATSHPSMTSVGGVRTSVTTGQYGSVPNQQHAQQGQGQSQVPGQQLYNMVTGSNASNQYVSAMRPGQPGSVPNATSAAGLGPQTQYRQGVGSGYTTAPTMAAQYSKTYMTDPQAAYSTYTSSGNPGQ